GTFSASQNVQLSTATPSAEIYYTLDGTTPTPSSTLYTGPIPISTDTTINAIASAPGYVQSAMSSATFTFTYQTPAVTFKPAAGTYLAAQAVTLADSDANAKIYYTTDASTPSAASNLYSGPIQVSVSETIKAIAIDPSLQNSNFVTSDYVIQNGGTSINFGNGFSSIAGLTLNGSAIATNDTRLQLTNGGLNEAGSVFWNAPINIQAFTTNFEFQLSNAQGNGFTFTIQNVGPTALGGNSAGLGYQDIQKSVAVKFNFYNYNNEGSDSTGVYTDGQPPVLPTVDISSSGIQLGSGDSIQAQIVYDGTNLTLNLLDLVTNHKFAMSQAINIPQIVGGNTAYVGFTAGTGGLSASQKLLSWTYGTQAVPPTFSPAPGPYSATQNVTLSSVTGDAAIYYTTDGSAPTAASTLYSAPIAVATSETISAIAISPTLGTSKVATAAYVIQVSTATPTFLLSGTPANNVAAGGSTTSSLTVTPSGGFTGSVALTCAVAPGPQGAVDPPTCTVTQPAAISGTQPVSATLTVNTQSATTPATYTANVTGTSGSLTETTGVAVIITGSMQTPNFALSGTPVNIASPGTSATSTVTVTPSGGFTGSVALACAITSSPSGAIDPPTCSVAQPGSIAGSQAVTSTLTVNTTKVSAAAVHNPFERMLQLGCGGTVAALLFFCLPFRRRRWQALVGLLFFALVVGAVSGCGGSSTLTSPGSGTTAGTYTITVTGSSGSLQATTQVAVTVQ
ncbi:MAG: chitobiase/beta-hexosaminidase C-terminal domain-containing protein, partial [Candidatus Eremiobacteraeota bacterium]|nr:chitobiase/beta-hexosaminidase C-terminal domain-containing protein [Candidatus Eremiobacteraeota bacterium]